VIGDMKGKDPGIEERRLPMRLHVRAIVSDGTRAFVGSQSLRKDDLENRREVGLIINNPGVARKIMQVFESDWADSSKRAKAKAAREKRAA
jgi:phosphatidylserine/phosphatidylglycerophosphate/cardiolipin synthase-like enzyme